MTETAIGALFDVDGTLVDSNYLHAVTWWQAFTQAGHDVPMAAIHHAIGMGSDQPLDALLPGSRTKKPIRHPHRAWRAECHVLVPAQAAAPGTRAAAFCRSQACG